MTSRQLAVIIPVLNEAANVVPLVVRLHQTLDGIDWEALFVDDDSTDGTVAEVTRIAAANSRVRLILRVQQPGLANSAIQGMLSTLADVVCVMDGDGQHDPAFIPALMAPLRADEADVVSAARDLQAANNLKALGKRRAWLSRLGNALARHAVGRDVSDPLSGFFAMRRERFLGVVRTLGDTGFKLLFDILACDRSLRHVELALPLQSRAGGKSKLSALIVWQFGLVLAEKLAGGWLPSRLFSFLAVGSAGLLVHMTVLYAVLGAGGSFAMGQSAAALCAMTFNFWFNNLLTFADRRFYGRALVPAWLGYLAICSVGLVANVSVATWTYGQMKGPAAFAALAGIAMDVIWKFVISDRILWRKRRKSE